jgi:hypothetical protein
MIRNRHLRDLAGGFAPQGIHVEEDRCTGRYEGVSGEGAYMYESLTDTLMGGTYKGKVELP